MCEHPLWIRNRRYRNVKTVFAASEDYFKSSIALAPWDISRQWLMVPCGHCKDCLRRLRNDWFVRLERELARCKAEKQQAVFITITIDPKHYEDALRSPSSFIRKWNERVRHRIGHSFKHVFFQEFGCHPESGSEPRLHFHGFLFGCNVSYSTLRSAVSDLGFIWLGTASLKRARYVVKYVTKQIQFDSVSIAGKKITIDGVEHDLSFVLQSSAYTRKFVSPGVGDYLGTRRAPSASVATWDYLDFRSHVVYTYAIPRYYDRYLKSEDVCIRAIRSSDAYARFSGSRLVRDIVAACVSRYLGDSALSNRETYCWQVKKFREFSKPCWMPDIEIPAWIDGKVIDFWLSFHQLNLIT